MKKIRNCLVWLIVFALKLITVPFFFFGWIFIAILTFFHWVIDLLSTREDEEFLSEKEVHMRKVDRKNSRRHRVLDMAAERNYVPFFQQSRKKFNKFIPHKNHLLYREVLTASGESPSLLKDIISYQRNIVNKKSKRRLSRCRFFSCRSRSDPDCRTGNLPPRQSSRRRSQMESPKNRGAYLKVSM